MTTSRNNQFNFDRDTWLVLDRLFSQPKYPVHNQLNSVNDLMRNVIPSMTKKHSPIIVYSSYNKEKDVFEYRTEVHLDPQPKISRPEKTEASGSKDSIFPMEARVRNLTYSVKSHMNLTQKIFDNQTDALIDQRTEENIQLSMPCMIHSDFCHCEDKNAESLRQMNECPYDMGGYFIVNGSEKVVISQERPVDNKVLCFRQKEASKYDQLIEVRSSKDQRFFPVRNNWVSLTHQKEGEADQYLRLFFPYLKNKTPIPLMVAFRAIGITTDKEITELILGSAYDREGVNQDLLALILPSFEELNDITDDGETTGRRRATRNRVKKKISTQTEALNFISKQIVINMEYLEARLPSKLSEADRVTARERIRKQYVLDILRRELFPHVGNDFRTKALFLGYMTMTMLQCKLGLRDYDVRDHYSNKRCDLPGALIKKLWQGSLGRLIKEIKKELNRINEDGTGPRLHPGLAKVIQNCNTEAPIKKALSTGDWSTGKDVSNYSSTNLGIAQVMQRLSYIAYLSNVRRIQTPMEKTSGKITEPRKLDPTQYGYVCPNETPEGQQVGIVKNLAMTASVTISSTTLPIKRALIRSGLMTRIEEIDHQQIYFQSKVFLNGEWMGCTIKTEQIYRILKRFKRSNVFSTKLGIYWNYEHRELHIRTDGGRYTRPLYVVDRVGDRWIPKIERYWDKPELDDGGEQISPPAKDLNWAFLEAHGYVEYLDPEETENCMIAMTYQELAKNDVNADLYKDYTHLELHPTMCQGIVSQMIPFSDHNQSPRNCFQCLDARELVVMWDGSLRPISQLKVGDQVITVDPETHVPSIAKVINQYVRQTEKQIVRIWTKTGKELVCTDDHPILTQNGWKMAGKLDYSDKILMMDQMAFQKNEPGPAISAKNFYFQSFAGRANHDRVMIADITIDRESHSFITGKGLVVHNSSMGKQALGMFATNYNARFDTMAHVLCYPQKPLVQNRTAKYAHLDVLPHGQQCIVAVATYTGYNQEDSVLINKSSLERGKFNSLYFKTYVSEMNPQKSSTAEEERFGRPDPNRTQGMKHGTYAYDHLDDDGFAKLGSQVNQHDVLIGKTVKLKEDIKSITGRRITHGDISIQVKPGDHGFVDKRVPSVGSYRNTNADNNPFAKIRVVKQRIPVIGDKLASRMAQKATIGLILPEEDMPFTDCGMVPDIVMNPHALPSRMTCGQMLECIFGKSASLEAEVKDATPFTSFDKEPIGDSLERFGFERNGEEVMYNGFTGEMMNTSIFIGPVYYQRLKHMVEDKIHARPTGRVNNLTKQSVEGRNQGGGLRLGEMERDVFISHGMSAYLKERFWDSADAFRVFVGKESQTIVVGNPDKDLFVYDNQMLNPEEVSEVHMPHAMKLLIQEFMSMGIDFRIITEDEE